MSDNPTPKVSVSRFVAGLVTIGLIAYVVWLQGRQASLDVQLRSVASSVQAQESELARLDQQIVMVSSQVSEMLPQLAEMDASRETVDTAIPQLTYEIGNVAQRVTDLSQELENLRRRLPETPEPAL
jgi:chromosome segregation ATPase